jgi:hypothetical protein
MGIESDEDLLSLHGKPRFAALVARPEKSVVKEYQSIQIGPLQTGAFRAAWKLLFERTQ